MLLNLEKLILTSIPLELMVFVLGNIAQTKYFYLPVYLHSPRDMLQSLLQNLKIMWLETLPTLSHIWP